MKFLYATNLYRHDSAAGSPAISNMIHNLISRDYATLRGFEIRHPVTQWIETESKIGAILLFSPHFLGDVISFIDLDLVFQFYFLYCVTSCNRLKLNRLKQWYHIESENTFPIVIMICYYGEVLAITWNCCGQINSFKVHHNSNFVELHRRHQFQLCDYFLCNTQ